MAGVEPKLEVRQSTTIIIGIISIIED